jgi:hypothetical protein
MFSNIHYLFHFFKRGILFLELHITPKYPSSGFAFPSWRSSLWRSLQDSKFARYFLVCVLDRVRWHFHNYLAIATTNRIAEFESLSFIPAQWNLRNAWAIRRLLLVDRTEVDPLTKLVPCGRIVRNAFGDFLLPLNCVWTRAGAEVVISRHVTSQGFGVDRWGARTFVRRTEQKEISTSFLGLVATPLRLPKLWGLCRLSNEISGALYP